MAATSYTDTTGLRTLHSIEEQRCVYCENEASFCDQPPRAHLVIICNRCSGVMQFSEDLIMRGVRRQDVTTRVIDTLNRIKLCPLPLRFKA